MAFKNLSTQGEESCSALAGELISKLGLTDGIDSFVHSDIYKRLEPHERDCLSYLCNDQIEGKIIYWSPYSEVRLRLALERYNQSDSYAALKELLSRYYYDRCQTLSPITLEYPPLIQLELTSICNYRCIFCYQKDHTFSGSGSKFMGHMDFDMFKSIIDEISGKVPYITIASRGEPTMYKYFEDAMDYIRGKFLDIKINTNASLLTEKRASKILDTCHTVVFSIDTPDPDMYKNVRINGDLSKVLGNIKRFNELRFRHERRNEINTRASGVYFNTLQDFDNFTDFSQNSLTKLVLCSINLGKNSILEA